LRDDAAKKAAESQKAQPGPLGRKATTLSGLCG
jgi:hypothetical protein